MRVDAIWNGQGAVVAVGQAASSVGGRIASSSNHTRPSIQPYAHNFRHHLRHVHGTITDDETRDARPQCYFWLA